MKHFHASSVLLPALLLSQGCTDNSSQHVPDYSPPTILLFSPVNNSIATDSVFIRAFVHDNVRVARVEVYIDSFLAQSILLPPWQCYCDVVCYDTNTVHTLLAKAYDVVGNITSSVPISFTSRRTEQGLARYDSWPQAVGSTWTFVYAYNWYDWGITGVGAVWQGSYAGTLTWEVVSTTQVQNEVKSTFKQRFVGTATELAWTGEPGSKYSTTTYNIDTTSSFELTVQADYIVRLIPATNARWHGQLFSVFKEVNAYRYPLPANFRDSVYSYYKSDNHVVVLARNKGPVSIRHSYGGNSVRFGMDATLISSTQRNERMTSGKTARTH